MKLIQRSSHLPITNRCEAYSSPDFQVTQIKQEQQMLKKKNKKNKQKNMTVEFIFRNFNPTQWLPEKP